MVTLNSRCQGLELCGGGGHGCRQGLECNYACLRLLTERSACRLPRLKRFYLENLQQPAVDAVAGLQVVARPAAVLGHDRVSRSYTGLRRAVIGRELHQARLGELLGQHPEILRISATEAINRLIRITNHKQPLAVT